MKTIGIFYGSSTGTTEDIAKRIATKLGVDASNLYDVAKASPSDLGNYEALILGSSTWGAGDLQDDWYDFLAKVKKLDLSSLLFSVAATLPLSATRSVTRSEQSIRIFRVQDVRLSDQYRQMAIRMMTRRLLLTVNSSDFLWMK